MYKLVVLCGLLAVALGRPRAEKVSSSNISRGGSNSSGERRISYVQPRVAYSQPRYEDDRPLYNFDWAVRDDYSGIDMGHQEDRDGYNTQGSYRVLLPDGRVQTVTYTVNGDSGFVANVEYSGDAQYNQAPRRSRNQGPRRSRNSGEIRYERRR